MSWPCYMIDRITIEPWENHPSGGKVQKKRYWINNIGHLIQDLKPGAMWRSEIDPKFGSAGEGPSICVVLPGGVIWRINHPGTNGFMWDVSGEPPNITAKPSINYQGVYHGFLTNGVLTDDVEGRKF